MLKYIKTISTLENGSVSVLDSDLLPFNVERVYYIHGVPKGGTRGYHAHKHLKQILVAVCGRISVTLDDGAGWTETYILDSPEKGLLVFPGFWRVMRWDSEDAVLLVCASLEYDESDYIRHYGEFVAYAKGQRLNG